MPAAADAKDIGRPTPALLEIEVLNKFKRFDKEYADHRREEYPGLVKPPPGIGASGAGGVEWIGLNQDPCQAKFLAKQGIVRGNFAPPKKSSDNKELLKKGFSLSGYLSTAPLPYPHWQGELHGPFSRPRTEGGLSRAQSVPATAVSKRTSMRSSAVTNATRSSVAEMVSKEVKRQLENMSCHEHYLEEVKGLPGKPDLEYPAPTPSDLRELIYDGVSGQQKGRYRYLYKRHRIMPQERSQLPTTSAQEVGWKAYAGKGKFVGKMLERMKPPPDMLTIY